MTDPTPGTDLVYTRASIAERRDYAKLLAGAGSLVPRGLYETVRLESGQTIERPSPAKIFLVAETGNMLSIHPVAAMQGVNVIEGKPSLSPALMSALVRRAGHKLRVSTRGSVEGGDFAATATLIRSDDPDNPFTSTWTPQRGARAGLCGYARDEKSGQWVVRAKSKRGDALPWEKYTEALCKARAISEACRDGAEDALLGVHYTPEELGARVDESGAAVDGQVVDAEVIDAEVVEEAPAQEPTPEQAEQPPADDPLQRAPYEQEVADQWAASINDATNDTRLRALFDDATSKGALDRWADDPAKVREPKTIRDLFFEARARLQERVP